MKREKVQGWHFPWAHFREMRVASPWAHFREMRVVSPWAHFREMRQCAVLVLTLALAASALAFDSETWLGKRAVLAQEAIRLQAAYTNFAARAEHPSEAVTITLEQFPDGTVKTVLFAGQAVFFRLEKFVWTKGLVVRKFGRDGQVVARIEADTCVIDQTTKSGWCEGHAVVTRKGSRFEGDGVYFSSPESYVSVFSNSDLRTSDTKMEVMQ